MEIITLNGKINGATKYAKKDIYKDKVYGHKVEGNKVKLLMLGSKAITIEFAKASEVDDLLIDLGIMKKAPVKKVVKEVEEK